MTARRGAAIVAVPAEAWRNLRAFRAAYAWLLRDFRGVAGARLLAVVGLNLAGVLLQWAVIGGVIAFVSELAAEGTSHTPVAERLGLSIDPSPGVIALWAACVLVLVVGAAGCAYAAESFAFELARRYVARRGRDAIAATLRQRSGGDEGGAPRSRRLQLMLARDHILRALLVVQRALRTVLMVIVAAAVLLLIDPLLTAVVTLVAGLFVLPYYRVSQSVVRSAATLEDASRGASATVKGLVDHATSRDPGPEVAAAVPDLYPDDHAVNARWRGLRDITLGAQKTAALMTGMVGTCLVAVVVAFGAVSDGETSWAAVLTYIIGLNFASGAFTQLAGQVTAANRFLPYVQDFRAFTAQLAADEAVAAPPPPGLPPVRASRATLPGSATELELVPGVVALCVWPEPVDRLGLEAVLRRLVDGAEEDARRLRERAFFYGSGALPPVPARVLLGERGAAALDVLDLRHEIDGLPDGDATVLTPAVQERLSPLARYLVGVVDGLRSDLLVLAWKPFSRLPNADRERALVLLASRPVLFLHTAPHTRQPSEITHTIVLGDEGVAGMGPAAWFDAVAPDLAEGGKPKPGPLGVGTAEALDDIAADV